MGAATAAKASDLDRKYSAKKKCSYDSLPENVYYPKCKDAKVTHTLRFANGTALKLCAAHARWYEEVHPFKVPIIDTIEPTPCQRDLSDAHHKRLADVIN